MTTTEPRPDYVVDLAEYANDPERITEFSVWNDDVTSMIHTVEDNADAIFTWRYDKGERPRLDKLYEKAKTSQWNGQTDLDWSIDVDPYKTLAPADPLEVQYFAENPESPLHKLNEDEWADLGVESMNWSLSQFMHGEQGALLCTAKIVETVPWIDAKYYAATQVVDEARHVEAFARYLDEKMPATYPINENLKSLIDQVLRDERWDLVYLGMQVVIEGLALAAFGLMLGTTQEPLLKAMLRYVMADEARHVAFGILSLQELYDDMDAAEFRVRQEFAYEACNMMRRRTLNSELWPSFGISNAEIEALLPSQQSQQRMQHLLFSKIVPNCRKLGLLDHRDGWLRERFEEMGIIQYEHWENTAEALTIGDAVEPIHADASGQPAHPPADPMTQ